MQKAFKRAVLVGLAAGLTLAEAISWATTQVDYTALVTSATTEVTGAVAAGATLFGLVFGISAGLRALKKMGRG